MAKGIVAGTSSGVLPVIGTVRYKFDVSGSLNLPQEEIIGGLLYNKDAFTIDNVKAQVRVAGTSQYILKVISYDNAGINPITHISQTITLSSRIPLDVAISQVAMGADRTIEMSLEQLSGTPAEDFSLTLQ